MSTNAKEKFDVTRKQAAEMLNITTRTLDRYVSKKKLTSKNIAGRIFLSSEEIINFAEKQRGHSAIKTTKPTETIKQAKPLKPLKPAKKVEKQVLQQVVYEKDEDLYEIPVEYVKTEPRPESPRRVEAQEASEEVEQNVIQNVEEKVYEKLYTELKGEVKSFQQRIEGANYRVGQLESQLKVSVPLLEHQKLLTGHKKEKYNKKILYLLLAIILALQPAWLILAFL